MSAKFFFCFLVFFISGCSTKLISINEKYDKLIVNVDKADGEKFYLKSNDGSTLSYSYNNSGRFLLKTPSSSKKSCLYISNEDGEKLNLNGSEYFYPKLYLEYYDESKKLSSLNDNLTHLNKEIHDLDNLLNENKSKLRLNRANNDSICSVPKMKPLPSKPNTRCSSYKECYRDATQICFAIAFGAEGCSLQLSKEGVPGVIAGPSCGAVATTLAQEKYGSDSLIIDVFRGGIDDFSDSMMESDKGLFLNAIGLIAKSVNYTSKYGSAASCRNDFVERHYTPLEKWNFNVKKIKNEPQKEYNQCISLAEERSNLNFRKKELNKKISSVNNYIYQKNIKIEEIKKTTQKVNIGCSGLNYF